MQEAKRSEEREAAGAIRPRTLGLSLASVVSQGQGATQSHYKGAIKTSTFRCPCQF